MESPPCGKAGEAAKRLKPRLPAPPVAGYVPLEQRFNKRANELRLVWDPPTSDGDLPLRWQLNVMGQTGAVAPGLCGTARAAAEGEEQDGLGGFFPASNYIDLGLFQHAGPATATQKAPVKYLSEEILLCTEPC
eukprot:Skav211294  [mRNA]  locus=scaffold2429:322049:325531:- [translate_table: standard]